MMLDVLGDVRTYADLVRSMSYELIPRRFSPQCSQLDVHSKRV